MGKKIEDELWEALRPFIKEHPLKKDTVLEEDVEMLISGAVAFHVEKEILAEVRTHPDGVFWDFLQLLPPGVPIGQEYLLYEDDEEE